jgi:GDP-D-mannose dehydratase
VEVVRGDLGNFGHVLNVVKTFQPKVIYHIGGMLRCLLTPIRRILRANAMGTFHVLEAAKWFDVESSFPAPSPPMDWISASPLWTITYSG